MEFQIKYVKKGEDSETLEEVKFKNEAALKRWYKSMYEKGKVEFSFFDGWNKSMDRAVSYSIRNANCF